METRESLEIIVFDVRHGDTIVLVFPGGSHYAIVDCNLLKRTLDPVNPSESRRSARDFFHDLTVETRLKPVIEFACLTHPHLDHYRGYGELLMGLLDAGIEIKEFWDYCASRRKAEAILRLPKISKFDEEKNEMLKLIKSMDRLRLAGCNKRNLATPMANFWSGCGVEIDLLAPGAEVFELYLNYLALDSEDEKRDYLKERKCLTDVEVPCRCAADDNTVSSVLHVRYGKFSILLAADCSNCAWRGIENRSVNPPIRCDAIKVSHHGSKEGNFPSENRAVWESITPPTKTFSPVISGGYRANLPHEKTLSSLEDAGVTPLCTGPGTNVVLRPLRLPGIENELVSHTLYGVCEREEEVELDETPSRTFGRGTINITGFSDGTCTVITEK